MNYLLDPELQAAWAEEIPYYMSNSKVKYGPNARKFLPSTAEERAKFGIMLDYKWIGEHFDEVDERLRKEVYVK